MGSNNAGTVEIALVHYPVVNKTGETIGSAVTNLDLHDIARAAKTYGVDNYYIITPYEDQKQLVTEILNHWLKGHGAQYNPARKSALEIVTLSDSFEQVIETVKKNNDRKPTIITTSAKRTKKLISYNRCKKKIEEGESVLLLFGTAHGLAQPVLEMADNTLPPIDGVNGYNHLSVRSAVSIVLDRLLGTRD